MKAGQRKHKKPGGGGVHKRRQGAKPHDHKFKKHAKPKQAAAGVKRREPEAPALASLGAPSGDADDFEYMMDDMEDYKPAPGEGGDDGDSQSDREPAGGASSDAEQEQQRGAGGGEEGAEDAAAAGEGGGKKAKKRRKRGPKLSALEFEASRQMARQIAESPAEEQADWLWASYQQTAAASALERGGLTAEGVATLPAAGSLEERLKALAPGGQWQEAYCSREGPKGSPSLLLVSPSAIGAVGLIKLLPAFNKACRVGKLFAKHFKVEEQEEVLRSQVMCIAAGTPNRLCKLADGGALRLGRLTHVVVDCQLDAKQRDILAIPETRADWWQLYERHLKPRVDAGSLKLALVNSDRLRGGAS
ncbi:hypothetical protein ABPG75_013844 [Micractinium tetrahymenae]